MTKTSGICTICRDPSWLGWWISSIKYVLKYSPSGLLSTTERTPQTLNAIPANRDISRKCLHKLQEICGHRSTLPSSYIVPGQIVIVGSGPIATDAIADVWEGIYLSKRVSIKCLKIPPDDGQTLKKVRVRYCTSLSCPLNNL